MLWKRLSAARNAFTKRRKAYFAELESEREERQGPQGAAGRRGRGAGGLHRLGPDHQRVPRADDAGGRRPGRADRDDEAELWKRFRAAQDKFFTARAEVFSAKDAELREHAEVKQQLLEEARRCCR